MTMDSKYNFLTAALVLLLAFAAEPTLAESRWGAKYFPNVELTSHTGEKLRFFDDLIKDKVVVINFIYTTCPDVCPMETAQLTRVQRILGDRLGHDVFFYSITIDPDHDTPEVLKDYRDRFGAKWTFLTGDEQDIISLRRKLGLYIEDIGGGENNHNVNMIMGNQKTGRWMKRSPFENPYVMADQIGNWLHGWKMPQELKDYASVPELRNMSAGEKLFRTRCTSCHTIDGTSDSEIGPDLLGVTRRRDRTWLINWMRAPDEMLANQDSIAIEMYNRFNQIPMPNMDLSQVDVKDLINYMQAETDRVLGDDATATAGNLSAAAPDEDVVATMNAWVREALPGAPVNAGYMTLINLGREDLKLESVDAENFGKVEIHNMATVDGMMKMQRVAELTIPASGKVSLKPGGMHLMLMQPEQELASGDQVRMKLNFSSGRSQTLTLSVRDQ